MITSSNHTPYAPKLKQQEVETAKLQLIDELCDFMSFSEEKKMEDAFRSWEHMTIPLSQELHIFREHLLFNSYSVMEAFLHLAKKTLTSEQKEITLKVLSRFSEENGIDLNGLVLECTQTTTTKEEKYELKL